jgi:alginate O-acetyltransferase complex protein AlgJ
MDPTPLRSRPPVPLPRWAQLALCVLGVAVIGSSLADRAWPYDPTPPPQENRQLAAQPRWSWRWADLQTFPARFEAWDRDHFGLRSTLIHWHANLMLDGLGISPQKDVLIGQQGWLYYAIAKSVDTYRCLFPYQPAELEAAVRTVRERRDWLAARRIRYLNAWAPIKPNVYPEYLPSWLHKEGPVCRLDQWLGAMRAAKLPVLDLRPAMRKAKAAGLSYHRTDSHWNPRGAWFAYEAIVDAIAPLHKGLRRLASREVHFFEADRPGGDLARLADLAERYRGPEVLATLPQRCQATLLQGWTPPKGVHVRAFTCPDGGPKVVMFHDSFGGALLPFLSQSVGRLVATEFGRFDKELIERERPDLVLELHVERQLQPDRAPPP